VDALYDLERVLYVARVRAGTLDPNDPQQRVVVRSAQQPPVLEVSRSQAQPLELSALPVHQLAPFEALAGVGFLTKRGQPIIWRLTDAGQPHALVAGTSGSGKSNLLMSLLLTLATNTSPEQLTMYVVDGGNSSLMLTARLAHTARFVGDAEGALDVVHQVAALVLERKRRSLVQPEHRALLVVDELANILAVLGKQQALQLQQELAVVAAEGRKFGVHLVAATQKPLAEVTGTLTKSNAAVRFVGAMLSWRDAETAADMPGTGAERLSGHGDFIVRSGSTVRRFQAPLVVGEFATVRAINKQWASVESAAVHAGLVEMSAGGAHTGALVVGPKIPAQQADPGNVRTSAPVTLPLPRNRPPTPAEAQELRRMYAELGSKNQVLQEAYGTKNALLLSYVSNALVAQ
jgi:hypothetical protein